MYKEIVVIGDIEMGAGNLTDDFIADKTLSKEILELADEEHPIDLILNGDTFDFLKCPCQLQPKTEYPRHITAEISVKKLNLIHKAHKGVFDSWKKFLSRKDHNLYFILGNHDHDLVYKEVQDELGRILGKKKQVHFPGLKYKKHRVYVEHGQQYDFLFAVNFEKLFLKHKGQSILNFPFTSFGLITRMMRLKEEHPFLERIFPRPELLTHHRVVARKVNKHTIGYFVKSLLYYPFRYYSDPTYSFPTGMLREFYHRVRSFHFDVDNIMTTFIKKKKIRYKIIVLGHVHEKKISKGRNRVIIHPGTWRDEYDFNSKTRELIPRTKRYVRIQVKDNDELDYQLIDVDIRRSIIDFDAVLKNEKKYLQLAADEEGYDLRF